MRGLRLLWVFVTGTVNFESQGGTFSNKAYTVESDYLMPVLVFHRRKNEFEYTLKALYLRAPVNGK